MVSPQILERHGKESVWIKIYPWTKPSDIKREWKTLVVPLQKRLMQYRGKEKEWDDFERDLKIYKLFLKVEKDLKKNIRINKTETSNSPYVHINYYTEFIKIQHDYPNIDVSLGPITARCKKELKDLILS